MQILKIGSFNKLLKTPLNNFQQKLNFSGMDNPRLVYPTEFEDCFERMSFEEESPETNFWRDEELQQPSETISEPYYHLNDKEDVRVAEDIIKRDMGLKPISDQAYTTETNLGIYNKRKLKYHEFENVHVHSIMKGLDLSEEEQTTYATRALRAWEKGVPTPQILRAMEKSILRDEYGFPVKAEVSLFNFLLNYPNKRAQAVIKLRKNEVCDEVFPKNYSTFDRKYFANQETLNKVFEECKVKEWKPYRTVSPELCKIVCLLRKKHTLDTPARDQYGDYILFSPPNIDKNAPWSKTDSELIQALKPKGYLDEEKYESALLLLSSENKSVDFVLRNIDGVTERRQTINKIINIYYNKYGLRFRKERESIIKFLQQELENDIRNKDKIKKTDDFIPLVKLLQERKFPIRETWTILERTKALKSNWGVNVTKIKELIDNITAEEKVSPATVCDMISDISYLTREKGSFGKKEETIIRNKYFG